MNDELLAMLLDFLISRQTAGHQDMGGDIPRDDYGMQGTIGGLGAYDGPVQEDWADSGISGSGTGTGGNLESATRPYLPPPPPAGYIPGSRPLSQGSPGIAQVVAALASAGSQASASPNRVPGNVNIQTSMGYGGPLMDLARGHDQYSRGEFSYIPTFEHTRPENNLSVLDKTKLGAGKAINNVAADPGKQRQGTPPQTQTMGRARPSAVSAARSIMQAGQGQRNAGTSYAGSRPSYPAPSPAPKPAPKPVTNPRPVTKQPQTYSGTTARNTLRQAVKR